MCLLFFVATLGLLGYGFVLVRAHREQRAGDYRTDLDLFTLVAATLQALDPYRGAARNLTEQGALSGQLVFVGDALLNVGVNFVTVIVLNRSLRFDSLSSNQVCHFYSCGC
jgi:Co/Zn/Cd efflux system component